MTDPFILNLSQINKDDIKRVGGKAANLGEMIQNNFLVPEGFVITTMAYSLFLKYNKLETQILNSLATVNYDSPETIETCSKIIQESIEQSELPLTLVNEIEAEYSSLPIKQVAIRSSATVEDLPTASFAGQLETYLSIQDLDQLLQYIKRCYASLWTSRAISYRHKNNIQHVTVKLAVIIQEMVPAVSAGVLFTVNPVSLKQSELLIESNFGLGESIVSGQVIPDQFTVLRDEEREGSFEILSRETGTKKFIVQKAAKTGVEVTELSDIKAQELSLNDQQVLSLAKLGRALERSFGTPQDIEWAIDHKDQIYLLQSRPITSLVSSEDDIVWTRGYFSY